MRARATHLVGLVVEFRVVFVDFRQFWVLEALVELVDLPLVSPFDEVCPHELALWKVKLSRAQEAPAIAPCQDKILLLLYIVAQCAYSRYASSNLVASYRPSAVNSSRNLVSLCCCSGFRCPG